MPNVVVYGVAPSPPAECPRVKGYPHTPSFKGGVLSPTPLRGLALKNLIFKGGVYGRVPLYPGTLSKGTGDDAIKPRRTHPRRPQLP